jgi:hypothetical protein
MFTEVKAMFGKSIRKISWKANGAGKKYKYLNLPEGVPKGETVELIQVDEQSVLLVFK